ncbi:MAG: hypothetical protein EP312_02880 [Gammaproteobacteria bacterium]|nr:MAG: hypothetical protein EP312_02880 [Gammaproteobacteria bacterium]
MTFTRKALVAAVALAASSFSLADDQTNTGFYLALDAGQASMDTSIKYQRLGDGSVYGAPLSIDEQENAAISLSGGFAFNDYVALELGYTNYGDNEDTAYFAGPPVYSLITEITDMQAVNLSLLVGTPVGEDFGIYFRTGYQAWDMDVKASDSAGNVASDDWNKVGYHYGFGFKLDMTDNLSLRNEYVWHKFDDDDVDLDMQTITLGLVFTF